MIRFAPTPNKIRGKTARRQCGRASALGALVLIAGALPAAAQAVTYSGSASAGYFNPSVGGTTATPAAYSASADGAVSSIDLSDASGGTITARADAGASGLAGADGQITYSFHLIGEPDVFVPVRVQAHGYAAASGAPYSPSASAMFRFYYPGPANYPYNQLLEASAHAGNQPYIPGYDAFNIDQVVLISSNLFSTVQLEATAYVGVYRQGVYQPETALGFVDPIFTIDPAFADRFTIEGVPGQATPPTSNVPESATWGMLVIGFGAIGGAMRRTNRMTVRFS